MPRLFLKASPTPSPKGRVRVKTYSLTNLSSLNAEHFVVTNDVENTVNNHFLCTFGQTNDTLRDQRNQDR